MLALIHVHTAQHIVGVELLSDLPKPPALRWSAFLIGVSADLTLDGTVAWALEMRAARPVVPIGVAGRFRPDQLKLLDALSRVGLGFNSALHTHPLVGEDVVDAVAALREASVEREILNIWLSRWPSSASSVEHLLVQLIAHGVKGGKAKSLRVTGHEASPLSYSTVVRWLKRGGLPSPSQLLRDARLTGAALREQRLVSPTDASGAAGYATIRIRRQAERRRDR